VEKRIKEITPQAYNIVSELRKINELLVNASLDEMLTISEKILTIIDISKKISTIIIGDEQNELGASSSLVVASDKSDSESISISSLEVIVSDTSIERKPKLPEEWVSLLQKSQPDRNPSHDVRGAWHCDDRRNDWKHLDAECTYRANKNLTYLSESWKLQTNVEKWTHLKALVEAFEEVWLDSGTNQPLDKKHSFPPREYETCKNVIVMLNDRFRVK